jgi:lipocalin
MISSGYSSYLLEDYAIIIMFSVSVKYPSYVDKKQYHGIWLDLATVKSKYFKKCHN